MNLPKITVVTPSFNQGEYIEETIQSILQQKYANLEYIVIDGGSTDQTVAILEQHNDSLASWVSEPDNGQAHALNKGFSISTGEIMAYLNADDKYCPWVLATVAAIFSSCPEIQWLTSLRPIIWDAFGNIVHENIINGFSKKSFYAGETLGNSPDHVGWIQQESTFWRRELWEKAGGILTEDLHYAMDFDLWARFFEHENLVGVLIPLGGFRIHEGQKSSQINNYYEETNKILSRYHPVNSYNNESSIVKFKPSSRSWHIHKQALFSNEKLLQHKNLQIENLKTRINQMNNSFSWKITKPLRKINNLFSIR